MAPTAMVRSAEMRVGESMAEYRRADGPMGRWAVTAPPPRRIGYLTGRQVGETGDLIRGQASQRLLQLEVEGELDHCPGEHRIVEEIGLETQGQSGQLPG
jgi:hypothetical protein